MYLLPHFPLPPFPYLFSIHFLPLLIWNANYITEQIPNDLSVCFLDSVPVIFLYWLRVLRALQSLWGVGGKQIRLLRAGGSGSPSPLLPDRFFFFSPDIWACVWDFVRIKNYVAKPKSNSDFTYSAPFSHQGRLGYYALVVVILVWLHWCDDFEVRMFLYGLKSNHSVGNSSVSTVWNRRPHQSPELSLGTVVLFWCPLLVPLSIPGEEKSSHKVSIHSWLLFPPIRGGVKVGHTP